MERSKKRGAVVDSNEEEVPVRAEVPVQKEQEPVKVKRVKTESSKGEPKEKKTAKPAKKVAMDEESKEKYAFELISRMKELYRKDIQLQEQMKVANNKIENIDELATKIIRKETQESLIKLGILSELKLWLEPLPDNSLPNQKIKRAILDVLSTMKVTKSDLLNSGIGKIVHFYSKNPKEALEIRKKAATLIKKWKGMIIREETADF